MFPQTSEAFKIKPDPKENKDGTVYDVQGMSYKWIIIGQLREFLTQDQKEKEELEDLN
jgi:hypothetical protein